VSDYSRADRCCDLVMKGGITSGILYPPAICRIAERFHLVGIGGSSAGAIAACAAAAAEYRRRNSGDGRGFDLLEQLPGTLGGGSLTGLFRPDRETAGLFALFLSALGLAQAPWLSRVWWKTRAVWAAIRHRKTLQPLIENGFGLCTGMANGNPVRPEEIPPLTEWLAGTIDRIAGKEDGTPLTFGDLWQAPVPPALRDTLKAVGSPSIDLRAVTTCISFGRPMELPLTGTRIFAFDPSEWRRFFPSRIVDYLVEQAGQIPSDVLRVDGRLPLPVGEKLPVVVAARMSLSFPGLFTLIPLYAVDHNAPGSPMRKVWFSDGGITSNLPISGFDALFPSWPTLAINLQYIDESGRPARTGVDPKFLTYMIARPGDGTADLWTAFDGVESPVKQFVAFAGAIFRSAQVWHDNGYLRLPGYRDRVVEIWLRPDEGGMNLTMPSETIRGLVERGNAAGISLRDRFTGDDDNAALSWDGHRWTRLRSAMAGLATYLRQFKGSVDHPLAGDRSLDQLLSDLSAPPVHRFESRRQLECARQAIAALRDFAGMLEEMPPGSGESEAPSERPFSGGPRPKVEIGSRPPR